MQTEQSVLASMLIDSNCSQDYGLVNTEDFTNKINRDIYIAIKSLVQNNKEVDYLTVYNNLNKKVDMAYLIDLNKSLPSTANFKQYVEELKDKRLKRELRILASKLINEDAKGQELAELAEQEIFKLREDTSINEFATLKDTVMDVYSDIEKTYYGEKESGIKTGYKKIDELVGGLRKQEYILLGARPSIGKTALGINITEKIIARNQSVAFFSFEMSKEQVIDRLIKGLALTDSRKVNKVKGSKMDEKDWQNLQRASSYLLDKNLYIDENPNRTVSDMQSMCRKLKREGKLDLVIIDYLQKVRSSVKGNKREQLEQVSNDIKNMAKSLDVPVLVITSLSRANEQREIKKPILSDLRESGQLEFDADVVMFLHRDYYHDRSDESKKEDADLVVAKNRNGMIGRTKLIWKAEYTKFLNIPDNY